MLRFRSSRRFIVGIAAVMMMLCQVAMAASACLPGVAQSNAGPVQESCHQASAAADDGQMQEGACTSNCQSQHASFEFAKVQVYVTADLPLLMARVDSPAPRARFAALGEPSLAHSASPPLPIVLCRLLN